MAAQRELRGRFRLPPELRRRLVASSVLHPPTVFRETSMPPATQIRVNASTWEPYPISAAQIIAGDPAAQVHWLHASSANEPAYYAGLWTAERSTFRWDFELNETLHVLAGRIRVSVDGGPPGEYVTGDIVFFPIGSRTVWEIVEPLKKMFVDTA
jgi:uncharacterized cupin superfamily protein